MTLNDHMANITDITFANDDRTLYTCAADGAVYEWAVGRSTVARESDYVMKNVVATRVAVSPTMSCVMATFEVESTLKPHVGRMSTFRSFSRQNSDAEPSRSNSPVNDRRPGVMLSRGESGTNQLPLAQLLLNRAVSGVSDTGPLSYRSGAAPQQLPKAFLVYWNDKIQSQQETILELSHAVTAISFGVLDGRDEKEICVLGMSNGEVIISVLPIPLRVVSDVSMDPSADVRHMVITSLSYERKPGRIDGNYDASDSQQDGVPSTVTSGGTTPNHPDASSSKSVSDVKIPCTIDKSLCRVFSLHEGAVTHTLVSASGLWIFTSGVDGGIFMLNTNLKAKEQIEVSEAYGHEHHIVLTDKAMLKSQQARIEDKEAMLEEMGKEKKHAILQLESQREADKRVLEETMIREISKRDDIILQGRTELQQANKRAAEKLEQTHKSYRTQLAELEVMYEKKLAHEALYLDNMKQAYDEYVTHARMDLEAFHRKAGQREEKLNQEKEEVTS